MKAKSEVFTNYENYSARIKKETGHEINTFRSDNGGIRAGDIACGIRVSRDVFGETFHTSTQLNPEDANVPEIGRNSST